LPAGCERKNQNKNQQGNAYTADESSHGFLLKWKEWGRGIPIFPVPYSIRVLLEIVKQKAKKFKRIEEFLILCPYISEKSAFHREKTVVP
ncbi:MAG: hypothetical protein IKD65_01250, partial [Oscillospiraceae bacterium]|nr:hypothetical protein [Oscillospiraceae bacterium]